MFTFTNTQFYMVDVWSFLLLLVGFFLFVFTFLVVVNVIFKQQKRNIKPLSVL